MSIERLESAPAYDGVIEVVLDGYEVNLALVADDGEVIKEIRVPRWEWEAAEGKVGLVLHWHPEWRTV
jgi:hypothetical protein